MISLHALRIDLFNIFWNISNFSWRKTAMYFEEVEIHLTRLTTWFAKFRSFK